MEAFMRDKPEMPVEIPDRWGTVLFRKQLVSHRSESQHIWGLVFESHTSRVPQKCRTPIPPPSLFWIFNDLLVLVTALDLVPKPLHPKLRTGYVDNVVKDDQPACLYQGRIHLEIFLNPIVSMVSINKQ